VARNPGPADLLVGASPGGDDVPVTDSMPGEDVPLVDLVESAGLIAGQNPSLSREHTTGPTPCDEAPCLGSDGRLNQQVSKIGEFES
jgi:hypothetical protein